MTSLALLVALLSFFAVWVALGGTNQGSGLAGVALFGGAIAIFRLMGRFERPAQVAEQPPPDASPAVPDDQLARTSSSTTMSNQ